MRTIEVTVGDHRFKMTTLPGFDALVVHQRLIRHALPALGAVQALFPDGVRTQLSEVNVQALGGAVRDLLAALPEAQFLELVEKLLSRTQVVGGNGAALSLADRPTFDNVFCENAESVYLLMWEAVKLNYSRFLDRSRRALSALQQQDPAQSPSNSPPASENSGTPTV